MRRTYIGITGIVAFVFANLQLMVIILYPMIGYLGYKVRGPGASYSLKEYSNTITPGAYWLIIVLFSISLGSLLFLWKDEDKGTS